jgi:protein O-GlcNAc transferase
MNPATETASASLAQAVASCLSSLATYIESPASATSLAKLRSTLRSVAHLVTVPSRTQADAAHLQPVMELQKKIAASGVLDKVAEAGDLALASELGRQGPTGLLAAMLLVPAAQWSGAPALKDVPRGLWASYTAWLFHTPQGFCAVGQVSAYAAHYLCRLHELVALVEAEPRARHIQTALQMFTALNNSIPLYFAEGSLRKHMELRGRLLAAAGRVDSRTQFPTAPRNGRRLRIGFINRHFAPQTETYTTLPTFEQLDPARFDVKLFVHRNLGTTLENYAAARAASFTVLPANLEEQLHILRAAALDVVVFGTNVTAVCHEVTLLALHRVAPLQVVNNSSCTTSGLPEIDLYVSGTATEHESAPSHFSERLGLLQGPAHAFNYKADQQAPKSNWTRAALGLPEDSVVFVSAANFYKIIPEMREAWARLLAAVPGSRLLLHPFNPNWSSSYPIKRFCAEFETVLAAHGVSSDRLVVSSLRFPSRYDVAELLKVGDLYLDSFPFAGVNSLIDPLEIGLPVVTLEGESFRSRMGAALLRNLGLNELIAADAAAYHGLCVRLAGDPAARAALSTRINAAMERQPLFLDTLAASDAFGALLEQAYDELASRGREAFRRDNRPIIGSDVFSTVFRQARGRALLDAGEANRATDYFLNAIQQDDVNPSLWRDLAEALSRSDRISEAVEALQTCLQLDARHIPGWQLLAELSKTLGHGELLAEAKAMLGTLQAPASGDKPQPRVLLYTDDPGHGGVAHYNHSILSGLTMAGYSVACAQTRAETPLVEAQRELGVSHLWIPYDTNTEFTRTLDDHATARRLIEAAKPDLIVFSDCCPVSNMAARDAALALGVPYLIVIGFVGSYLADRFKGVLNRLALQYARARAVIAVSLENLELLHARFGLPVYAGQVIHYGRPEQFFAPRNETVRARLRAELDLPTDAVVCFTAARLTAVKGFQYQVMAAKQLVTLTDCEKLHFVWAGEGEERAALEKAIATSGLTRRVHLLGHRWDVTNWYDAADIFVLPSDLEGMPLAIMEAMAKGLPVVATAVSGIPEELGDTGQLLPSAAQNRNALVSQLIRTLHHWVGDPALRRSIGEAGRARANAMFRESLMIERTVALISVQLSVPSATAVSV